MHRYDIYFAGRPEGQAAEHVRIEGPGTSLLLGWAQRHADGRRFEMFEDGVSLGGASFDPDTGVWSLFPASQPAAAA